MTQSAGKYSAGVRAETTLVREENRGERDRETIMVSSYVSHSHNTCFLLLDIGEEGRGQ